MATLRADAEANRRLILEAAAAAFAEEGFDVCTAEIARRAGVGNATVFRRFPTKDALVEAIVEHRVEELVDAFRAAEADPDPWAALVAVLEAAATLWARDRGFLQASEERLLCQPGLLPQLLRPVEAIEPLVARAQAAGVLRDDVTALDLLGAVKGTVTAVPPLPGVRDDAWRRPLALLLDALRPAAAHPLPAPTFDFDEVLGTGRSG